MTDLWTEATRDPQQERLNEALSAASQALASKFAFVLGASSKHEFEDRMALVGEHVERVVQAATVSDPSLFPIVHEAVLTQWEADFDDLGGYRAAQTQRKNSRRGYERQVARGKQVRVEAAGEDTRKTALAPFPTATVEIRPGEQVTVYAAPSKTGQPKNAWIAVERRHDGSYVEWFGGATREVVARRAQGGPWFIIETGKYEWLPTPASRLLATRKTAKDKCKWLVEVPTASLYPPEAEWYPDSPSDVYTTVECGGDVTYDAGGWTCSNGHNHRTYGGPEHQEYWDEDEIAAGRNRFGRKMAAYMEGVDCPMSQEGFFIDGPAGDTAVCPTCGQTVPVNAGPMAYDDNDEYRQVVYPYVHLLPGKTLSDRLGSRKTASLFDEANAAYERQDQGWFNALSKGDLLTLWDAVSGENFATGSMTYAWDDEVYEALYSKGHFASRKQAGTPHPSGTVFGWPRSADGEIACPSCGSNNVTLTGSNLGSDVVRGNMWTGIRCNDCGTSSGAPLQFTDRSSGNTETLWDKQWGWKGASRKQAGPMFPGAGAQVYYNEAGEPTGWDEGGDEGDFDPNDDSYGEVGDEWEDRMDRESARKVAWSIDQAREVVNTGTYNRNVDGMMLDAFSASALVNVYDALSEENKAKLAAMSLDKAMNVVWKLLNKTSSMGQPRILSTSETAHLASTVVAHGGKVHWAVTTIDGEREYASGTHDSPEAAHRLSAALARTLEAKYVWVDDEDDKDEDKTEDKSQEAPAEAAPEDPAQQPQEAAPEADKSQDAPPDDKPADEPPAPVEQAPVEQKPTDPVQPADPSVTGDPTQAAPESQDGTAEESEQVADPTTMEVGQGTTMSYVMAGGGNGSVEVTFVREDNGIFYFNGPTGEFGVAQREGKWIDAASNEFTFGVNAGAPQEGEGQANAPTADQQQVETEQKPPAKSEDGPPKSEGDGGDSDAPPKDEEKKDDEDDEKKKGDNPFAKKSGSLNVATGNATSTAGTWSVTTSSNAWPGNVQVTYTGGEQ